MINDLKNNVQTKFSSIIQAVPVWMIKEENIKNIYNIILAAAKKSFLHERYLDVLKQEDKYWGQVALEMLSREEVPRWVDSRRHISQYNHFGNESWMELYRILFHKQLRRLLFRIKDLTGPILDLGCGCGWLSLELSRLGKNVYGIDASESSLSIARFFYKNRNYNTENFSSQFCGLPMVAHEDQGKIQYENKDLNYLSLPEKKYSAVVVWESLHHIHNIEGLIEQVRFTLKPDGFFIVHETLNEYLNGLGLQKLLTKTKVLNLLTRIHSKYHPPDSKQTQKLLFDLFRETIHITNEGEELLCSPFEGVSGQNMINVFKKHFDIKYMSFHHHYLTEAGGFNTIMRWTDHLGFAPKVGLIKAMFGGFKKLDDWLIKFKRVIPRHGFFILKPKKSNFERMPLQIKALAERIENETISDQKWDISLRKAYKTIQDVVGKNMNTRDTVSTYSMLKIFNGTIRPAEEFSSLLLITGWHLEEGDYRWTNGNAEVYYCFPKESKRIEMEVVGSPLASSENPHKVSLLTKDKVIVSFNITVPGWQKYCFNINDFPRDVVRLLIKSDIFIPKELNLSDDSRNLGIAIKYIEAK